MALIDETLTYERYVPGEPGEMITFRHLTRKQLQQARQVIAEQMLDRLRRMGPEVANSLPQSAAADRDPLLEHDVDTLLRHGIVSWTYDAPATPETIERLSEDTAEWAARTLLEIAGVIRTEETSKNA